MQGKSNPVTPAGYAAMRARYDHLLGTERPAIVEIVSWAAGNGDRSENGDYLYGRKRMREIDRELAHLARRMKAARVIDPAAQPDEQDASPGRIGWSSPVARAIKGAAVGDLRSVRLPGGLKEWEVMAIDYA